MPVHAKEFLDTIFDNLEDDEFVCVSRAIEKKDGSGVWFKSYKSDARQFRKWNPETQAQAWYFCVSTVSGELNEKATMVGRGRRHLRRYYCLVLDDIGTKGTPPPVEPSWKIETSPGNYQWGYFLDPGDDWSRHEALTEFCHRQGWGDGGAGGSYRLMRLPGSANLKPGRQGFRSVVGHWEKDVWSLDELAEALGCDFEKIEVRDVDVKAKEGGAAAMDGIDPMLDWLVDGGYVVRDTGLEWVDIVCPWADQHTTGENVAGYSPLGRGTGEYVQTRAFNCMHEHCQGKKLTQFRKWAKKLGAPDVSGYDPLPWLQDRYTYIVIDQKIADIQQRPNGGKWLISFADWGNQHKGQVRVPGRDRPVDLTRAFLESKNTVKVISTIYDPSNPLWMTSKHGQLHINVYTPPNWEETDDLPAVFLEHVRFLFGEYQDLFLDWLAWKFQNPGKRSWAIICVADAKFGVGRSWLRKALSSALQGHVRPATLSQLIGKDKTAFNDWGTNAQFVIVEEAKDAGTREDFYQGYETFKQTVDNNIVELRVNPKYEKTETASLWFNALIFTNHADAMVIPEGDRRICVLPNPPLLRDESYYEKLHASINDGEGQRIYWFLKRRDVKKFGHVYPPDTPAKFQMLETSKSPADEVHAHVLEHLPGDIVTRDIVKEKIRDAAFALSHDKISDKPGGVLKHMWLSFGNLRGVDRGARYTVSGTQTEVRAVRNKVKWKEADVNRDAEMIIEEIGKNAAGSVIDFEEEKKRLDIKKTT